MKDDKQRLDQNTGPSSGLGDDQGTRVGSPTPRGKTGAGSEATTGSEPVENHETEHRSKYGGGSREENGSGQRPA
jgi:hypothetical protein